MNINDHVWVRLTEDGVKRWEAAGGGDLTPTIWHRVQMWHLIAYLGRGSPFQFGTQMIMDNEIALEDLTKKPKSVPVGPAMDPYAPMVPVPAAPLTRTEIFLRLVDSFCRQPGGLTDGGDPPKGPRPIEGRTGELIKTTEWVYNTWGGK